MSHLILYLASLRETIVYCIIIPVNLNRLLNTGYLIQARTSSDEFTITSPIWGKWIVPVLDTPRAKTLQCRRSNVTSDSTTYEVMSHNCYNYVVV